MSNLRRLLVADCCSNDAPSMPLDGYFWSNYFITYWFYGAVERSRTSDLLITNQLLYQLSYNSIVNENQARHYSGLSYNRQI